MNVAYLDIEARELLTVRESAESGIPEIERGLEALKFLERSRELADEPVPPPGRSPSPAKR